MDVTEIKQDCYIAVDIEKDSCTLDGAIVAVGFAVKTGGLLDGDIHSSFIKSFYIKVTGQGTCDCTREFEAAKLQEQKRCKEEFWDKHPGLFELYTQSEQSVEPQKAACEIAKFVNELYSKYNVKRWFSDNPAFDLGHLDHWLWQYSARPYPLRHSPQGKYVSVQDPSEQYRGLLNHEKKAVDEMSKVSADGDFKPHEPSYDAECILRQAMAIKRVLNMRAELFAARAVEEARRSGPYYDEVNMMWFRQFMKTLENAEFFAGA